MSSINAQANTKNPLTQLPGVGPKTAESFSKLGISHPSDLLFHLPIRYQDRTNLTPADQLENGNEVLVFGIIDKASIIFARRRTLIVHVLLDDVLLTLRFFHFSQQQKAAFITGHYIRCFGVLRQYGRRLEMVHPEYRIFAQPPEQITERELTPIYPTTEGISVPTLRRSIEYVLKHYADKVTDYLPEAFLSKHQLPTLTQAIQRVHHPTSQEEQQQLLDYQHPAQKRLILEELLAHHLALRNIRAQRQHAPAPSMKHVSSTWRTLTQALPFSLTNAQIRVIDDIDQDIIQTRPMIRLVQGDVGSGKTIVAAAAVLRAIDNGYQVALMAPTELLAEQHRNTFSEWLSPLNIDIAWLTGKLTAKTRRETLETIASHQAKLIIGTHALFQDDVQFAKLGLVIVDEQHRFGVEQRLSLIKKSGDSDHVPHQLIMSATPIPRSLAMIFYADLDVSSIDELPPGRKAVTTAVIANSKRDSVEQRILHVTAQGFQVYWVCPLIDQSDKLEAEAATETYERLQKSLPDISIALIHGRMKAAEKEQIMQRFVAAEIDLLVATTVIEVGVNVPNANLMIIENAERLGLAQLHQLRGRVGRGGDQANCLLIYQPPLSQQAKQRLSLMRETNDGFKIAQADLEHRGFGELFGTRQTGIQQLRIANLGRDKYLLPLIEEASQTLLQHHPEHTANIIRRWITHNAQYSQV